MRKIASAKTKFRSKKSMATAEGSASFIETPANFGVTPAGTGLDTGFDTTVSRGVNVKRHKSAAKPTMARKKKATKVEKSLSLVEEQPASIVPVVESLDKAQSSPMRLRQERPSQYQPAYSVVTTSEGASSANLFRNEEFERKIAAV